MSRLSVRGRDRGLVFDLLAYAASDPASRSVDGISARRLEEVDDRQLHWVSDGGLAPLLYRAARPGIEQVSAARREMLLSADLSAIAWHGNLIDATREILTACEAQGIRLTLLKGISISDQYYPDPHLRAMGDVDVLVPPLASATVESMILKLGYTRAPLSQYRKGAHHGAPLFHPGRGVSVEVHHALFPEDAGLSSGRIFSPAHVAAHSVSSMFHGNAVNRLADELQLAYTACSWVRDLSRHGVHASFLPPLFDAVYLLNARQRTLDWDALLGWLDNPMAVASLYVMLCQLSRSSYPVDPGVLSRLASSQDLISPLVSRVLHGLLDEYLVGGRPFTRFMRQWHVSIALATLLAPRASSRKLASIPWNIIFPPPVEQRYSVRYQIGRIARVLRGKG